MGVISGIFGNASRTDLENIIAEFSPVLVEREEIQRVYKFIRDYFVFTNVRLVIVEKLDLLGKKREFHSIPYARIMHFSIETSGHFELKDQLKLYVAGVAEPITQPIDRFLDIFELQTALAKYLL